MNFTLGNYKSHAEAALKTLTGKRGLLERIRTESFIYGLGPVWNNVVKRAHGDAKKATWRCGDGLLPSDKWNTPWLDEKW